MAAFITFYLYIDSAYMHQLNARGNKYWEEMIS